MAERRSFFKDIPDVAIAVAVVAIVFMLIIPLPTMLLDVLMATNFLL